MKNSDYIPSIKKSLFIGLGGTGAQSILFAKGKIKKVYGEIPPMIRFVVLDTDEVKPLTLDDGTVVDLDPTEYLHMTVPNALRFIQSNPDITAFFPEKNKRYAGAVSRGAGQIRSLGRVSLVANYRQVEKFISGEINKVTDFGVAMNDRYKVAGEDLQIAVVYSLAGGTGSGTFIDIAYMIRSLGVLEDKDKLMAFLLLPDVFTSLEGTRNVKANTYGALKEMDFLFSSALNGVEIDYGVKKVKIEEPPYDLVFAINNSNEISTTYNNVKDLTELIGMGLFLSTGIIAREANSTWDNLSHQVDDLYTIKEKNPIYCGFGVSELHYDGKLLSRLCALKASTILIDKLVGTKSETIQADVETRIDEFQIREDHSKDQVLDAIHNQKPQGSPETPDKYDRGAGNDIRAKSKNFLVNVKKSIEKSADDSVSNLLVAKTDLLDQYLAQLLNADSGVGTTIAFLRAFTDRMKQFYNDMEKESKTISAQRETLEKSYASKLSELKEAEDSNILVRKKRVQDACEGYVAIVRKDAEQMYEFARRERAIRFFANVISHSEKYLANVQGLHDSLLGLRAQFQREIGQITGKRSGAEAGEPSKTFRRVKPFVNELHETLISGTTPESVDVQVSKFIAGIPDKSLVGWATLKDDECRKLILEYTSDLEVARKYKERDLDGILKGMDETKLKEIVEDLDRRSAPLWKYDKANVRDISQQYLIGLANEEKSILKNSGLFDRVTGRKTYANTNDPNRVLFYRMEAAVPAFTLANSESYKADYLNPDAKYSYHVNQEWEDRMAQANFDIFPTEEQGKQAILAWSLAFIYGLMKRKGIFYSVKSEKQGLDVDDKWLNLNKSYRVDAYHEFANRNLSKELLGLVKHHFDEVGNKEAMIPINDIREKGFDEYFTKYSLMDIKPTTLDSPEYRSVRDLINEELKAIKAFQEKNLDSI